MDGLGQAAANAARARARVGDTPLDPEIEDAAAATARSGVLSAAIQARLDTGDRDGANELFTRVNDQLGPQHAEPLQMRIDQSTSPADVASGRDVVDDSSHHSADGNETQTDPKLRDEIARGLASDDPSERARWAGASLDEYKPHLSDKDFRVLTDMQRQISPYDGLRREGLGHPIGTLDQHAEVAIALTPSRILKPILKGGAGYWEAWRRKIALET